MSLLMQKYLLINALINRTIDLISMANGYVYYMLAIMAGHQVAQQLLDVKLELITRDIFFSLLCLALQSCQAAWCQDHV